MSEPFATVATPSFSALLLAARCSLIVSTYQSGKVVLLSADPAGGPLNAHFVDLPGARGLCSHVGMLVVATSLDVRTYHAIETPEGVLYLPRSTHTTGAIDAHDVVVTDRGAIVCATRFSCLAALHSDWSLVPMWRPPFVTASAPEDRCHLNGVCVNERMQLAYATALGESNAPRGWRANKRDGGVLLDVQANEVVCRGLSMPHSPRLRNGRLWLLEGGRGGLGYFDGERYLEVARLPGFSRGLTFLGPYALVCVSQARESPEVFGGVEVTERDERQCGVYAIDTRTGALAGLVRFEADVSELFDVAPLPYLQPRIAGFEQLRTAFHIPEETP